MTVGAKLRDKAAELDHPKLVTRNIVCLRKNATLGCDNAPPPPAYVYTDRNRLLQYGLSRSSHTRSDYIFGPPPPQTKFIPEAFLYR